MSLLPTKPADIDDERRPTIVGLGDDSEVFSVLKSGIAREILAELYQDEAVASELATSLDTSIQNIEYHLTNLLEADLIEVVDTCYSSKGREMDVYAPTSEPLTLVLGDSGSIQSYREALTDATR